MAEVKETVIVQETNAPEVVETKDSCAARIHQLLENVRHDTIQIGFELLKAKKLVKRGSWGKWLKGEFAWTQRTANNFMRIAERFGKMETGFQFQATTLQEMLALPVGEEEAFVEAQAAAGRPVENQTKREVKANVKAWNHRGEQITAEEATAEQDTNPEADTIDETKNGFDMVQTDSSTAEVTQESVDNSMNPLFVLDVCKKAIDEKLTVLQNFVSETDDLEEVKEVMAYLEKTQEEFNGVLEVIRSKFYRIRRNKGIVRRKTQFDDYRALRAG